MDPGRIHQIQRASGHRWIACLPEPEAPESTLHRGHVLGRPTAIAGPGDIVEPNLTVRSEGKPGNVSRFGYP